MSSMHCVLYIPNAISIAYYVTMMRNEKNLQVKEWESVRSLGQDENPDMVIRPLSFTCFPDFS